MTRTPDVAPDQIIASSWGNEVRDRSVQVFSSLSDLTTNWPTAPIGAKAITTDTSRMYTHRAAGAAGWLLDYNFGRTTYNTDANGEILVAHGLGRVPSAVLAMLAQAGSVVFVLMGIDASNARFRLYVSNTAATFANQSNLTVQWFAVG